MTNESTTGKSTWRRHRFAAVILACVLFYSLLGFLVVPWLAPGVVASKTHDVLGADLQIEEITFNPFTFVATIERVSLDAAGDRIARIDFVRANFEPTRLLGRVLEFSQLEVNGASLNVHRAGDGRLNLESLKPQTSETPKTNEPESDSGWLFAVEEFNLQGMSVDFVDETVSPRADLGLSNLSVAAQGVSTQPGISFPIGLSTQLSTGGRVESNGDVSLAPTPTVELALKLDQVSLELLHPYVKPLADITLDSGAANFTGIIASAEENPFTLTGDIEIVDLLMTETDIGTRLGSWDRVAAQQLALSLGEHRLSIAEVIADSTYADIVIARDGTVNLARAGKETGPDTVRDEEVPAAETPGAGNEEVPFDITIGRVLIRDASAAFRDHSLPLPFAAQIHELNGEIARIATGDSEPSRVALEGRVDEFGQVIVSGSVTPLEFARATDIQVDFKNVQMPKFSAYTIRFAGHEIASGKLDLDLRYTVAGSELAGENTVVLHDFELGDKVPHPGAADLPLGLAVALLKDSSGRIEVDLPIRGNLEDPQFQVGEVISSALGKLVAGIVASPFKLLGSLLGANPDELEALYFPPGRADLSPPQEEIAARLAEALTLRPQLILELPGAWVEDADNFALREQAVDAALETSTIDALFAKRVNAPLPEAGDDPVARTREMRDQVINATTLPDGAVEALADRRAINTRNTILAADPSLESRVVLLPAERVRRLDDDGVRMEVRLATYDD